MRDRFPEWYSPSPDEMRELYRDATVVVDANVLLSLYRVSPAQREEIVAVLRKVQERLWVPYQAALEFQRNRLGVVHQQARTYTELTSKLEDAVEASKKTLKQAAHEAVVEGTELLDAALSDFQARLSDLQAKYTVSLDDVLASDPVREVLDDLLVGHVGEQPDSSILQTRLAEAKRRTDAKVPPGYADADKNEDRAAGDYLFWCEVLDRARLEDRPVLLVTDDQKEDWFLRVGGRTVGPRPELLVEMRAATKLRYHQQTLRRFLELAGELLETPVDPTTIEKATKPPVRRKFAIDSAFTTRLAQMLSERDDPASTQAARAATRNAVDAYWQSATAQDNAARQRASQFILDFLASYGDTPYSALASDDDSEGNAGEVDDEDA